MPILLLSFKRNSDSSIVIHGFLTPNEKTSEKELQAHAGACPKFGPEFRAGNTIEQVIDVDSIPEFDEDAIGEWLDDEFGIGDEDEEPEEETEEQEPEEE